MIEIGPKLPRVINNYDDAFLTCLTCDHRGYYDWRLPTKLEYLDKRLFAGAWYERKTAWRIAWYVLPVRDV